MISPLEPPAQPTAQPGHDALDLPPLRVPRLPAGTIRRARVETLLDREAPLTVVCAPPGFGKTVALVRWASAQLGTGAEVWWWELQPGVGLEEGRGLLRHRLGLPADAGLHDLDAALCRRTEPVTLVLDGAERAEPDLLARAVDLTRRHPHVRVVVGTRTWWATPEDLAATVELTAVGIEDLRLDRSETRELAAALDLDIVEADHAHDLNVGWASLVHRSLLVQRSALREAPAHLRDEPAARAERLLACSRLVEQWWLERALPDLVQAVDARRLARVSLLARIDVVTAAAALGEHPVAAAAFLHRCLVAGVVRPSPDPTDDSVVMSSVVRRALGHLLGQQARPRERVAAHRRVVADLTARDRWHHALDQALDGAVAPEDPDTLAQVVTQGWLEIAGSRPERLREAVRALPETAFDAYPGARDVWAILDPGQGTDLVDLPLDPLPDPAGVTAVPVTQVHGHLTRMIGARISDRSQVALRTAQDLTSFLAAVPLRTDDPGARLVPHALLHSAITEQVVGDRVAASRDFTQTIDLGRWDTDGVVPRFAHVGLALNLAVDGRHTEATRLLDTALERPASAPWFEQKFATWAAIVRLWAAVDDLDPVSTSTLITQLAGEDSDAEVWGYVLQVRSRAELIWGESRGIVASLRRQRTERDAAGHDGTHGDEALRQALVDHLIRLGQGRAAAQVLAGCRPELPGTVLRAQRLALLRGDAEAAYRSPERADLSPREQLEHTLVRAAAALSTRGEREGARWGQRAAMQMASTGCHSAAVQVPRATLARLADLVGEPATAFRRVLRTEMAAGLPEQLRDVALSPGELRVLELLGTGAALASVAEQLGVTLNTVKSQTRSIYRKLDVAGREDAVLEARRTGLLDSD